MVVFRGRGQDGSRSYKSLFLEFLVLVVGFFVSLQVNEWQNDREERELESEYLVRLEGDLEKSSAALAANIERIGVSIEKMEAGLSMLAQESRDAGDNQRIFTAVQSSSITGSFEVFFATLDELKDTGYMRLIESTPLRESLGNLRQKYLQITKISQIRNMLRGNTFPVMTRYVKPVEGNRITFDAELVEREPRELYVAMSVLRTNLRYDLDDSKQLLELVDQSLAILGEELSSRD